MGKREDVNFTLTNTLTKKRERFEPIDSNNVRLYVCGPTVYDFAHIGNARPAIVFDVLYRLLRQLYGDNHVTYVRNITDVDDKIITRALRDHGQAIAEGSMTLNDAIQQLTQDTTRQYHQDIEQLGCLEPTHEPRATDFVLPRADGKMDMVTIIQKLLDKSHAYVATGQNGDEVLFDVASMPHYGGLAKRLMDDQQAGARVAVEEHKRNPADFVLWKQSSAEQPGWNGKFQTAGKTQIIYGRPGWHVECSAMSAAYLGEVFDIHGGGLDLIFPHHENEIAQTCCAFGHDAMAKVWLHNGFLQVEGQKMSKSTGNFITIHELLAQKRFGDRVWAGPILRLAMLMTHYRDPIDFSVRRLEEASNIYAKLQRRAGDTTSSGSLDSVIEPLCDDLNTVGAIHALNDMSGEALKHALTFLGLETKQAKVTNESEIIADIERRLALIKEKNWADADKIRDQLAERGIVLKDGKDAQTGERTTTWEVKA